MDERFDKIAYLYLSEGRTVAEVSEILGERGATDEQATAAISSAQMHLAELRIYRNGELGKTVLAA